ITRAINSPTPVSTVRRAPASPRPSKMYFITSGSSALAAATSKVRKSMTATSQRCARAKRSARRTLDHCGDALMGSYRSRAGYGELLRFGGLLHRQLFWLWAVALGRRSVSDELSAIARCRTGCGSSGAAVHTQVDVVLARRLDCIH